MALQIQYNNDRSDIVAMHDWILRAQKKSGSFTYYYAFAWYSFILVAAGWVSYQSDQIFALCVFITLLGFYCVQNWSYERQWAKKLEASNRDSLEYSATLLVDEKGVTEHFLGLSIFVPWNQVRRYAEIDGRLCIAFLEKRSFVIPLKDLKEREQAGLVAELESHGVRTDDR